MDRLAAIGAVAARVSVLGSEMHSKETHVKARPMLVLRDLCVVALLALQDHVNASRKACPSVGIRRA